MSGGVLPAFVMEVGSIITWWGKKNKGREDKVREGGWKRERE